MKASVEVLLSENLKQLKLSTMLRNLESSIRQAQEGRYAYEDFLLNLTEIELQVRSENREKRRLKDAKFPLMKPMEMFEIESAVGIDGRLIGELAGCEFISKCRNVIFFGKSGTGKTHLATGIGIEVCKKGFRTRFVTGCGLSNGYRLKESLAMRGKASRLGKKLGKDNDKSIEPGKKLGKKSGRAENA
ncbi:ATP-binding protein [Desulfobacterales bacterium HSG16]|nr:ATP-binding protein [Desulfobacterales bacterium HSG16]